MSQPAICTFCQEHIVHANVSWGFHHPSYASLASSAHRRCYICKLIYDDVQSRRKQIDKFADANKLEDHTVQYWLTSDHKKARRLSPEKDREKTALYRWSVRSLGRSRESNYVIAVTFRIVPQTLDNESGTSSEVNLYTFGLPERVFYCFPEKDLGPLLSPVNLGRSTNPEANAGYQIKKWMWTCGTEHKHCPKRAGAGAKSVPTRLLHVGGRRPGDRFRILDTKANKIKGPYVTLSHCWGYDDGTRKDTLRTDNLTRFQSEGIPWNFLSRTFKEAVEVTQFLEIDYIWIDSLCIIQARDNEDLVAKADWKREGSMMHKVYRNSYCNLAAADSSNSTQGLFRKREPRDVYSAKFESDGSSNIFGKRTWRVSREDMWDDGLLRRPLYTRGWVFQERMLAPRILHFSQYQIFWDCAEISACETIPSGLPPALDRQSATDRHWRGRLQEGGTNAAVLMSAVNDESPEDFWKVAVEEYTKLNLTNQSDKRPAIWGIAKLVRDSLDDDYVAGMWAKNLVEQLAWRVADCTVSERPDTLKINPSWSWASVKGQILVEGRSEQSKKAYQVTNHQGNALSFKAGRKSMRPSLAREPSESIEDELIAMGKELELVAERRKSSSSSRTTSQSEIVPSRNSSQTGIPTPRHSSPSGFPPSRQNSRDIVSVLRQNSQVSAEQAIIPNSVPGSRIMSPQPMSQEMGELSSGQSTPQDSEATALKTRDVEPELDDKRIAILGYLHEGVLKLDDSASGWSLNLTNTFNFGLSDLVIDAYPDTKRDTKPETTKFIILALRQQFEENESLYFSSVPSNAQKYYYVGSGILLQSTSDESNYVRTGALNIRRLSPKAWMQMTGKGDSGADDKKLKAATKFFLV